MARRERIEEFIETPILQELTKIPSLRYPLYYPSAIDMFSAFFSEVLQLSKKWGEKKLRS